MVVVALLLIQVKPLVQFKVPHKLAQAKQLVKFEAQKQLEVHNAHNCFFQPFDDEDIHESQKQVDRLHQQAQDFALLAQVQQLVQSDGDVVHEQAQVHQLAQVQQLVQSDGDVVDEQAQVHQLVQSLKQVQFQKLVQVRGDVPHVYDALKPTAIHNYPLRHFQVLEPVQVLVPVQV